MAAISLRLEVELRSCEEVAMLMLGHHDFLIGKHLGHHVRSPGFPDSRIPGFPEGMATAIVKI